MPSFDFNHFSKDCISKYSHIWNLGLQHRDLEVGRDTVQPVTRSFSNISEPTVPCARPIFMLS